MWRKCSPHLTRLRPAVHQPGLGKSFTVLAVALTRSDRYEEGRAALLEARSIQQALSVRHPGQPDINVAGFNELAAKLEAARRSAGTTPTFAVGPIEMEFAVALKKDAKAKAGVARSHTQKVKLTLTPTRPDGRELLISAEADSTPLMSAVPSSRVGR